MGDRRSAHLSDEQLAQFQDGEASAREIRHVETCSECAGRLRDLEIAAATYVEYQDSVRRPVLQLPPQQWRGLEELIADHGAEAPRRTWHRWLVPALAAALGLLFV